ncbi:endonuclease/exonuclease/phosphatase family protein [Halobellus rubicundus]|uniref:Endonuclease/exonuclease/phosphatase family protein n=1 Tax=Halobellus rubicundus TaxID=2996466 RepID=A0ABD5MCP6_9EURY
MDDIDRSRRRVLRAGAQATALLAGSTLGRDGLGTVAATPTATSASGGGDAGDGADAPDLSLATQNLGLGADFLSIARPGDDASIPERVGDLYAGVRASEPRARMRALADLLAREPPDVLALQEVALVRRGPRSGNDPEDPDAGTVVFDFLATLREALSERGVPYRPVAINTNADLEFPARLDGGAIDVRLTDRDALLVRADGDVAVESTAAHTYGESLTLPIGGGRTVEIDRGYAGATLGVGDESVGVVSTHLESGLEGIRTAQAEELAADLDAFPSPLVVAGDLNDGPERDAPTATDGGTETTTGEADAESDDPDAYGILTASLSDVVGDGLSGAGGTCCRPASLRPPDEDGLPQRIDHVLADGLAAESVRRVGADPVRIDGERRWVSDHAGVAVELTAATDDRATSESASATTTESPTDAGSAAAGEQGARTGNATDSGDGSPTGTATSASTPGFGVASAAVALLGAGVGALAGARRRRDDS